MTTPARADAPLRHLGWFALLFGCGASAFVVLVVGVGLRITCQRSWEHGRNRAALCQTVLGWPMDLMAAVLVLGAVAGAVTAVVCGICATGSARGVLRRANALWLAASGLFYLGVLVTGAVRAIVLGIFSPSLLAMDHLLVTALLGLWLAVTGLVARGVRAVAERRASLPSS
ncbi:MAG: hypothetical protein NT132_08600 [Microbacterium sp.]|uniref:hypothetical protein n=1 Tax=Microbacterium sp. TaxID=51671 RepID=UPI002628976D|nr:hypothetical protein [Microbacterium sp.]MCX6502447.1 hypothetical protein [Microbacterium sp.]